MPDVLYEAGDGVAVITLNRPERMNALTGTLLREVAACVRRANEDPDVKLILLRGSGASFCAGYDLKASAEAKEVRGAEAPGQGTEEGMRVRRYEREAWAMLAGADGFPYDPVIDYQQMWRFTQDMMEVWRSLKPVIARVQGSCVGGGSDLALCCDVIIMEETSTIGYPPARVWGCPTTGMWVYRLGADQAKRMLLTGDVVDGKEAKAIGLVTAVAPAGELDAAVDKLIRRMLTIPTNQLIMQKAMINQAVENMGLHSTQMIATLLDGAARHTPEGYAFKKRCEEVGFRQAVRERDVPETFAKDGPVWLRPPTARPKL
mmetsp:Transcript_71801/g.191530  ORF Transcript_71801/g.191530 Transcript_71801/m.191530 type:complete len:318 (+) Transcript_71801:13-966(+)